MLPEIYDPLLMALSYVVAVAASYTALSLAPRLTGAGGGLRISWLLGGTLALATGIWSTHLVSMQALTLPASSDFDLLVAILSFGLACLTALFVLLLMRAEHLGPVAMMAGGVLIGAGVAGVHLTEMAATGIAVRLPDGLIWIGASGAAAVFFGILSLRVGRRYRRDDPRHPFGRRLAAALIMGLALVGQHYSAMAGVESSPGPGAPLSGWLLPAGNLPEIVLVATLVILATVLVGARLDRREAARAALSGRMLAGRENERRGIARVLHDDVGQLLTSIKLNLQRLHPLQGEAAIVGDSVALVDDALIRVRALSLELRPRVLDELGLGPAVTWYANREAGRAGYTVKVVENVGRQHLDEAVETTAFRIVQQALTNVARHAKATNVRVSMRLAPRLLDLAISDDGVGFNVGAAKIRAEAGESLGLLDMNEMATHAGAIYSVSSSPGKGTTVEVTFHLRAD
ncbi:MAG: MHYT domain-containing protein [Gemmatimonadaceae bacterium]